MPQKFWMRWLSASQLTAGLVCSLLVFGVNRPVQSQELNPNPYGITADNVAKQLRGYFQRRWRNDPYFNEDLKYRIDIQAGGQVSAITGIGEKSQKYLDRTSFLKSGEIVAGTSDRGHVVWLALAAGGIVRTSLAPE
jgi:hypothetical protein